MHPQSAVWIVYDGIELERDAYRIKQLAIRSITNKTLPDQDVI